MHIHDDGKMAAISKYFRFRMVDFSTASTDSCLLHLLQEEFARAPSVAIKAYVHDEASACGSSAQDGRKEEFPEVGCECTRSRPHRGSRGLMHCFSIDFHVQEVPFLMSHFFYPKNIYRNVNSDIFVEQEYSQYNLNFFCMAYSNMFVGECILLKKEDKYWTSYTCKYNKCIQY